MADTTIEISGDARELEATFDKIERRQQQQGESFKSTAKVSQDSSRQIASANEAAANKGAESYNVILRELRKQGPEGLTQAQAIEKYLAIAGKAGRRSMEEIIDELGEFDDEAAKVAENASRDFKKFGDKGKEAFGTEAVGQLKRFAMGWIGIQTVINGTTRAIDAMRQAQQNAANSLEGMQDGNAMLLQVSDSPEEFRERRDQADNLASTYGITRQESSELIFNADSNNFLETAPFIAANAQVLGVNAQSTVAGQVPKLFENDPLSGEEAINATLAAAETSRLTFEQIASVLPTAAADAAPQGATADETLATLSVLADKFNSGDTAANRISTLSSALALDQGEEATSAEVIAEKNAAEDERIADERRRLRSLEERKADAEQSLQRAIADGADPEDIADRQTRVDRASRDVDEFDQSSLQRRSIETTQGRESLAGKGILQAVRELRDYSEADRRNWLGENKELNQAYNALVPLLETIEERQVVIRAARDASGTDAAPVNIRRATNDEDPRQRALREKRAAENRAEIAAEKSEAVAESNRQATMASVRAESYERGDGALVAEGKGAIQGLANTGQAVADGIFGSGAYRTLSWDAGDAMADESFTEEERRRFEALTFGANRMDSHLRKAEAPLLTPGETQTYLQAQTGSYVDPQSITPEVQRSATDEINAAAAKTGKMGVLANAFGFSDFTGENQERQRSLLDASTTVTDTDQASAMATASTVAEPMPVEIADEGRTVSVATTIDEIADDNRKTMVATAEESNATRQRADAGRPSYNNDQTEQMTPSSLDLRRSNELAEKQIQLQQQTLDALQAANETAKRTADNTQPRPPSKDPSAIQRAAARDVDARAGR